MISKTPTPPYYAVIFTSTLKGKNKEYEFTAKKMEELARENPGFLGIESARDELGISVSYWKDLASIKTWKENSAHQLAKEKGKQEWYASFKTRIALVEREY